MREDLDTKLCADFPEIFRDRHKPMTETAMWWGFACGDGWYPLINTLCFLLMSDVRTLRRAVDITRQELAKPERDHAYFTPERLAELEAKLAEAEASLPIASQVKEKFGGLRFYVDGGTDKHHAYITFAEAMSYTICEECGATKNVYQTTGWVHTTCVPCAKQRNMLDRLDVPGQPECDCDASHSIALHEPTCASLQNIPGLEEAR